MFQTLNVTQTARVTEFRALTVALVRTQLAAWFEKATLLLVVLGVLLEHNKAFPLNKNKKSGDQFLSTTFSKTKFVRD